VLISLYMLSFLGAPDPITGSFLDIMHPLGELDSFVPRELFTVVYGFVRNRPGPVKTRTRDVT
jgi:hypothetical protein